MTGTTRTSADLAPRRRRLLFRAWRRGIRELDLILGQFADRNIDALDDAELDLFEALLCVDDRDLLQWVTAEAATPREFNTPLFRRVCVYRQEDPPC